MAARFVVGIDLGTTHTVVAYSEIDPKRKGAPDPRIFEVPQLVDAARARGARRCCRRASTRRSRARSRAIPDWVAGELARKRGAEVAGRLVASAKSWLSHARGRSHRARSCRGARPTRRRRADAAHLAGRRERAAPRARSRRVGSRSPRRAARRAGRRAHGARVVRRGRARAHAARGASRPGFVRCCSRSRRPRSTTAMRGERAIRELASPKRRAERAPVLVCDVGGGTTDLSLMGVDEGERAAAVRGAAHRGRPAPPARRRQHGSRARARRRGAAREAAADASSRRSSRSSCSSCRAAKERSSATTRADEARVTVLGRGSKLVGGARSTTLDARRGRARRARRLLPRGRAATRAERRAAASSRSGCPTSATRRHAPRRGSSSRATPREMPRGAPDALLLNGGVFHAEADRARRSIARDRGLGGGAPARRCFPGTDPDLAVARGAVLYGFARRGVGVRIESGASHGYYVALGARARGRRRACSLRPPARREGGRAPRGRAPLRARGRPQRPLRSLRLRRRSRRGRRARDDRRGRVRAPAAGRRAPPGVGQGGVGARASRRRAPLDGAARARVHRGGPGRRAGAQVPPRVPAPRQRRCALDVDAAAARVARAAAALGRARRRRASVAPSKLGDAERILDRVFGKKNEADPRETKDVVRDLEKVLGERVTWTMEVTRALADRLLVNTGSRRRTAAHERVFWLLVGYCLRPGFGDPGDPARIERASPLFDERLAFPDEPRSWQQFFIAWRRMSGGLAEPMQTAIRDAFDPGHRAGRGEAQEAEARARGARRAPRDARGARARAAARRTQLGEWILERTWGSDDPRSGPPSAASARACPSTRACTTSCRRRSPSAGSSISSAEVGLGRDRAARRGAARARDRRSRARRLRELRAEVAKRLVAVGAKEAWVRAVRELVDVGEEERVAILGEGLPIGLRLKD